MPHMGSNTHRVGTELLPCCIAESILNSRADVEALLDELEGLHFGDEWRQTEAEGDQYLPVGSFGKRSSLGEGTSKSNHTYIPTQQNFEICTNQNLVFTNF